MNPTLEILRRGRVAIERRESIHYARHILGIADEHQAKAVLTKAAHELLTELASFPEKIRDPNWLQTLEADGQEKDPLRPATGAEIRAEQKKAAARRKQKTETMRKLRAIRA